MTQNESSDQHKYAKKAPFVTTIFAESRHVQKKFKNKIKIEKKLSKNI